jgi:DNA-binding NarL/FixJ family response regulator
MVARPRVGVHSEHCLCRYGTASYLRELGHVVVGTNGSSRNLRSQSCDTVILDLDHVGGDALEIVVAFERIVPRLVLLGSPLRLAAVSNDRAAHCILVETPPSDLDVLAQAMLGKRSQPSRELRGWLSLWRSVTPRQRDVMRELAAGRDNAAIASELQIRERTVKGHITELLALFGVGSRTALALLAERAGIRRSPVP